MDFKNYNEYLEYLKSNTDHKTSVFNKKLITTKYEILGLKLPFLRALAKDIVKQNKYNIILNNLNFTYYEEMLMYGFILSQTPYDNYIKLELVDKYIYVFDNWSVVDSFCNSLKIIAKNKNFYIKFIKNYLKNENEYIVRFAIVLLMDYYLDDENIQESLELICSVKSDKYYIVMAQSWAYATAFAKNYELTLSFLSKNKNNISNTVLRKTISKCSDSFRISPDHKKEIKTLLVGK